MKYLDFQGQCDEIERLLSAFCAPVLPREILDEMGDDLGELYNELVDTSSTFIPTLKDEKVLDQIAEDAVRKFLELFDELPKSAWEVGQFATPAWSGMRYSANDALKVFRTRRRMLASK